MEMTPSWQVMGGGKREFHRAKDAKAAKSQRDAMTIAQPFMAESGVNKMKKSREGRQKNRVAVRNGGRAQAPFVPDGTLDDCGHRVPAINGWAIFKDDEAASGAPERFAFRQRANVAQAFGHDAAGGGRNINANPLALQILRRDEKTGLRDDVKLFFDENKRCVIVGSRMTHTKFLPIAQSELQKLGFVVEEIPTRPSSQEQTPDLNVIGKSSCYLVELKVKGDDPTEIEQDRKKLESGKVVMKSTPTGRRSRMDNIICEGSDQMDDEDPTHTKFHVLWLHSWGFDAELLHKRFFATLFGSKEVIYPPNISPICYYFYDSSFFRLRDTLDAAILSFDGELRLCVNTLSPRVGDFRNSELYQVLLEGVYDPDREEKNHRGLIVDAVIDRHDQNAVMEYLKKKYGLKQLFDLDFTKHTAMIAASRIERL
jgi:hypothetical protein